MYAIRSYYGGGHVIGGHEEGAKDGSAGNHRQDRITAKPAVSPADPGEKTNRTEDRHRRMPGDISPVDEIQSAKQQEQTGGLTDTARPPAEEERRITSYNVCYTKLLRSSNSNLLYRSYPNKQALLPR